MKLLLHGCCADCTLKYIASINKSLPKGRVKKLTVYYYNPNIHPRSEYQSRLQAIKKICLENQVELIIPDWKPKDYFGAVGKKEGRCPKCWSLRLEETAKFAKDNGYSHFSSTLITSQYQNTKKVKAIAEKWAKKHEVEFYEPKLVCCDLKTSGFYKQFFCGCVYSLQERFEEKYRS